MLTAVVSCIWSNVAQSDSFKGAKKSRPFVKCLFLNVPDRYEQYSDVAQRRERRELHRCEPNARLLFGRQFHCG